MRKFFVLLLGINILSGSLYGQSNYALTGVVVGENNRALPGVTSIDIGSGQVKPVIRGLGFNRVVVVDNDIKHESQHWGADHGLEIDQYAIDLSYKSNNHFGGGSISLVGRKNWFFADFRFTLLDYGDYRVPTDSIDIYSYRDIRFPYHNVNHFKIINKSQ